MNANTEKLIAEKKIICIVRGLYGEDCLGLAKALHEGGVDLMECTFDQFDEEDRKKTAETISMLNEKLGDCMAFGAGTVTSPGMVKLAADAGAAFIVSPNTDAAVIKATKLLGLVSIPGALTPTEIKFAFDCGADFIKVFPANIMGVNYFKQVHAPLPQCRMLAVGGVSEKDAADYMAAGCSGVGVASCLFKKDWVKNGEWSRITEAARTLTAAMGV